RDVVPHYQADSHALLTRPPLYSFRRTFALDLHVLGLPPAFNLSHDQTLQFKIRCRLFGEPTRTTKTCSELLNTNTLLFVCSLLLIICLLPITIRKCPHALLDLSCYKTG